MIAFAPAALPLALLAGLASPAPRASAEPRCEQATELVSDPDPMDCPFCGGNPGLHVRALWGMQRSVALALRTALL